MLMILHMTTFSLMLGFNRIDDKQSAIVMLILDIIILYLSYKEKMNEVC